MKRSHTLDEEIMLLAYAAVTARADGLLRVAEFFEACIARRLKRET